MRHVIVIDDHFLIAQVVADMALCAGASSVAMASREEEAVALAREHRPWLILSDEDLRDGGRGSNAVRRIRRMCGPVPAIFITGRAESPDPAAEPSIVLRKPVSADQLAGIFDEYLRAHTRRH